MADPICRWRNPYLKTVREFIDVLPRTSMPADQARAIVKADKGDGWYTTQYQLACQLGLYYEEDGKYYPRFEHHPSLDEILAYLRNWIIKYYVPNPYTRGFTGLDTVIVHGELCKMLYNAKINIDWDKAKQDIFKEPINNDDILRNSINFYSDVISIEKSGNKLILKPKDGVQFEDLEDYAIDIDPQDRDSRASFFKHLSLTEEINQVQTGALKHNLIMYGAPGTGKSHELEARAVQFGVRRKRVTFYPDFSYAKFVGSYKPVTYYRKPGTAVEFYSTKKADSPRLEAVNEPVIDYSFTPGAFLDVLIDAFSSDEPVLLLIEEINRANAAAVFGEVFQLLDRKNGESTYKVMLSSEAMLYLMDKLGANFGKVSSGVYLPSNLYIWATMNSADQGVFHLDSAFKRRWSFEYLPLNENEDKCQDENILFCGKTYNWNFFRNTINGYLSKMCNIAEDRLIGPFFLSSNELSDAPSVKNKLLLYLRDDVLRHNHRKLFSANTFSEIAMLYNDGKDVFVPAVMDQLNGVDDATE